MRALKSFSRAELEAFLDENVNVLTEQETLFILDNPNITTQLIGRIAQVSRLTGFYSVRYKLVAHRQTPQAHAVKLVHYLYWFELLKLSVDVQVPAPVRRAIDTQLLNRVEKLSVGERIASARTCSHALIKHFLFDPDVKVLEALLANKLLREEDVLVLATSSNARPDQLQLLAADAKWSYRYEVRKALVLNPLTPRSAAASQLRHLRRSDLRRIHRNPDTSVFLRRCIERLTPKELSE
jgi:hypothetical protein